jgi:hypothetical protein
MGTNRLGEMPRSKPWKRIVAAFAAGAGAAQVARESLDLLSARLLKVAGDPALVEAARLLMLVPAAARADDFAGTLRGIQVDAPDEPDFFEVIAAVSARLDATTPAGRGRTDAGEMAQTALAETLSERVGGTLRSLFDNGPDEARDAFARQATPTHFGQAAAAFFGKFTARCLQYFLSRELPAHVGERLPGMAEYERFEADLNQHCREVARVVETFSAKWYSKEVFQKAGEVDRGRARDYAHGAMNKLVDALKLGAK